MSVPSHPLVTAGLALSLLSGRDLALPSARQCSLFGTAWSNAEALGLALRWVHVFATTQVLPPPVPGFFSFFLLSCLPFGAEKVKGVGLQLLLHQEGEEAMSSLCRVRMRRWRGRTGCPRAPRDSWLLPAMGQDKSLAGANTAVLQRKVGAIPCPVL